MKNNIFLASIILILTFSFGCSKDSEIAEQNLKKESITVDNLGDVHNHIIK